jgi:hypothetical protein
MYRRAISALALSVVLAASSTAMAQVGSGGSGASPSGEPAEPDQAAGDTANAGSSPSSNGGSGSSLLPSFGGVSALGANAGAMESWMLSGEAVTAAGAAIARRVGDGGNILVISSQETVNLGLPAALDIAIRGLADGLDSARGAASCGVPAKPKGPGARELLNPSLMNKEFNVAGLLGSPVLSLAGGLIGALKAETTASGLSVAMTDRALIAAVAAQPQARWVLPSEAIDPGDFLQSPLVQRWRALLDRRADAFGCRSRLAVQTQSADAKAKVAILDAAIKQVDDFNSAVSLRGADKPGVIAQAVLMERLAQEHPKVLRVSIEQAGGTLLKRTNINTMFGATGIRLTGGLVVSYRLTRPGDGSVVTAGFMVCRTALTGLKGVQTGAVKAATCSPI